jgi:hypothetical protein
MLLHEVCAAVATASAVTRAIVVKDIALGAGDDLG